MSFSCSNLAFFEKKVVLTKLAGLRNIPPDKQDGLPTLSFGLGQQHE